MASDPSSLCCGMLHMVLLIKMARAHSYHSAPTPPSPAAEISVCGVHSTTPGCCTIHVPTPGTTPLGELRGTLYCQHIVACSIIQPPSCCPASAHLAAPPAAPAAVARSATCALAVRLPAAAALPPGHRHQLLNPQQAASPCYQRHCWRCPACHSMRCLCCQLCWRCCLCCRLCWRCRQHCCVHARCPPCCCSRCRAAPPPTPPHAARQA